MKPNWGTIAIVIVALGICGALTYTGHSTESFVAAALAIVGAAQAQRAVRKRYTRAGDPPITVPDVSARPRTNPDGYHVNLEDTPVPSTRPEIE